MPAAPDFGITLYVKVAEAFVVLVNRWLILAAATVCVDPPVTAPTGLLIGIGHVYVVLFGTIPLVPFIGETVNKSSLQMVTGGVVIFGLGLIVITAVKLGPVHVPAIGVMVYVIVAGVLVILLSN